MKPNYSIMRSIYLLFFIVSLTSLAQSNYKITFIKSSNGKLIENQDPILVFSNNKQSLITSESIKSNKASFPFEQTLISNGNNYQTANLYHSKIIATKDSTSIAKQTFELSNESKMILGYNCKKAKTIINSKGPPGV